MKFCRRQLHSLSLLALPLLAWAAVLCSQSAWANPRSDDAIELARLTGAGKFKEAAEEWLKRYKQRGCEGNNSKMCIEYVEEVAWAMFWAERYQESYVFFEKIPASTYTETCTGKRARGMIASKIKMGDLVSAAALADKAETIWPLDYCNSSWTKPEQLLGDPAAIEVTPRASVPALRLWLLKQQSRTDDLAQLVADQRAIFIPLAARRSAIEGKAQQECTVSNYSICSAAKERAEILQFREASDKASANGRTRYAEFFRFWISTLEKSAGEWDRITARNAEADAFASNFLTIASAIMMGYAAANSASSNLPALSSQVAQPPAGGPAVSRDRPTAQSAVSGAGGGAGRQQARQGEAASDCLEIDRGRQAFLNRCNVDVHYQFCRFQPQNNRINDCANPGSTSVGYQRIPAGGRDTQYLSGRIIWIACKAPAVPRGVSFDGANLQATCEIR